MHGTGVQRHQLADADSHQLWRVVGDQEGKAQSPTALECFDKCTDNEEDDMSALEAILAAVPVEYREPLGAKSSAKEAWEAIVVMRVGFDRAKKVTTQLLKQE